MSKKLLFFLCITFYTYLIACKKEVVVPIIPQVEEKNTLSVLMPGSIREGENAFYEGKITGTITAIDIFLDNEKIGSAVVANKLWSFSYKHTIFGKNKTLIFKGLDSKSSVLATQTFTVEILQKVTSSGSYENVPYFYQYSNQNNASGSCQNTCVAMILKHYLVKEGKSDGSEMTPDVLSNKWGTKKAQSVAGMEALFNQEASERGLKIRDKGTTTIALDDFRKLALQNKPMIIHGYFTDYGHILVLLGFDGVDYICNDPAGKWSQQYKYGGYSTQNATEGIKIKYSKAAFEKAISPDGMVWMHDFN
jgi:hypothetical protein